MKTGPGKVKDIEIYPPAVQTELHGAKHQPDIKNGDKIGMPLDEFTEELWDELVKGQEQITGGSAAQFFPALRMHGRRALTNLRRRWQN